MSELPSAHALIEAAELLRKTAAQLNERDPAKHHNRRAAIIKAAIAAEKIIRDTGATTFDAAALAADKAALDMVYVLHEMRRRGTVEKQQRAFARRQTARLMRKAGYGNDEIAAVLGVHRNTVARYFR
ncbi:MAG: hypothetical protein ACPGO3_13335 [Magnetospiraceae bacterium]